MNWLARGPGGCTRFKSFLFALSIGAFTLALLTPIPARAQPVAITEQPQDLTVTEYTWTSLAVQASGNVLGYTWYRNGGFLTSGTNQLVFPITSPLDAGQYFVVLQGSGVSVTSRVAAVTVLAAAPDFLWLDRPFRKVAAEGTPVPGAPGHTFAGWASASALPLLTYRDGQVHFVAGTTAGVRSLFRWSNGVLSTLVFTNTPRPAPDTGPFLDTFYPSDQGAGIVNFVGVGSGMYAHTPEGVVNVITAHTPVPGRPGVYFGGPGSFSRRGAGVALSSTVVDAPGSFNALGAGIFFHDGATFSRIADDTTDLPGSMAGYAGRPTANAVNFDGTTIVFSTISALVAGAPGGFYQATPAGVITKLADYTDNRPGGTLKFSGFGDLDVDGEYVFGIANNTAWRFAPDGTVTNLGPGTFVSAAGPRLAYYGNTTLLRRWNQGTNQSVLQLGRVLEGKQIGSILAADGQGDDVAVLVRFNDLTYGIYVAAGPAPAVPVITREPLDVTVFVQATAPFTIAASGVGPLRYQWRRDGVDLPGKIGNYFEVPDAAATDQAGYSVVVSNDSGSVTSRTARLTTVIPSRPVIWAQPYAPALYFGSNATFSVTASGTEPMLYQWYKRDDVSEGPIPGAVASTLTLTGLGLADKASYFATISNAGGGVVSSQVTVFSLLPWIVGPPQPTTGVVGGSATFNVTALGVPPITYQWYKYPVPITTLPDQTNATLTLQNLAMSDAGPYAVRVTTPDGNLMTAAAELTVSAGVTPNAPVLGQPVLVSGSIVFNLPTQAGFTYQVQSKINLEDPDWVPEQTVPGDGTIKAVTIGAGGPQKFLRVVVLP